MMILSGFSGIPVLMANVGKIGKEKGAAINATPFGVFWLPDLGSNQGPTD